MKKNLLGEKTEYSQKYDPSVLYPIHRWPARSLLDIDKKIKMHGIDHWHAYEISWLDEGGKPAVCIGEFFFNAESENLVESKSLKLYLNSFNSERFANKSKVEERIVADLSALSVSEVKVVLHLLNGITSLDFSSRAGRTIDKNQISIEAADPDESLLQVTEDLVFDEELYSDLFRSNCPVTGQPDWASFHIEYTGPKIDEASLLSYLCSFRAHQGYHEECAERIFRDISLACKPTEMTLSLNFLRRGGIDINVYRSTELMSSDMVRSRLVRQ